MNKLYLAGVIANQNRSGIGCAIESDKGCSRQIKYYGIADEVSDVEIEALFFGLELCSNLGIQQLDIYTRSGAVFTKMTKGECNGMSNHFNLAAHQCRHLLDTQFDKVDWHWELDYMESEDYILRNLVNSIYDMLDKMNRR